MFRLHKRLKLRKLFDMDIVIVTSYSFAHGHNVSAQCDVSVPALQTEMPLIRLSTSQLLM